MSLIVFCKEIPTNKDTKKTFNMNSKCTLAPNFMSTNSNLDQLTKHSCPVLTSTLNKTHKPKRRVSVTKVGKSKLIPGTLQPILLLMFKPTYLNIQSIFQILMKENDKLRKKSAKFLIANCQRRLQLLNQLALEISHWSRTR
jgi:hypothetical protein